MLIGVDLSESEPARAQADAALTQQAASAPRKCPHADCGQLNSPDAERCIYCNRALAEAPAAVPLRVRAFVHWPWNEELEITDRLMIGREAPTPPALARRLEREFTNVSRRHAELVLAEGALWITDLGSSNGTFVNDTRIAPAQRVRVVNGARLRFAADLTASASVRDA
jgi:hypothetical protein